MPWTARVTASAFIVHYIHRSFIYPCFLRPSKQTPLLTPILALVFCSCNAHLQVCQPRH